MAVRDMITTMLTRLSSYNLITTNTTVNGHVIDTSLFPLGVSYFMAAPGFTDGVYKLTFTEGDEPDLSDGVTVTDDKIIPIQDPVQDAVNTGAAKITLLGNLAQRAGLHSTKRYIRADVVSTGVTTGATIVVMCTLGAQVLPA